MCSFLESVWMVRCDWHGTSSVRLLNYVFPAPTSFLRTFHTITRDSLWFPFWLAEWPRGWDASITPMIQSPTNAAQRVLLSLQCFKDVHLTQNFAKSSLCWRNGFFSLEIVAINDHAIVHTVWMLHCDGFGVISTSSFLLRNYNWKYSIVLPWKVEWSWSWARSSVKHLAEFYRCFEWTFSLWAVRVWDAFNLSRHVLLKPWRLVSKSLSRGPSWWSLVRRGSRPSALPSNLLHWY